MFHPFSSTDKPPSRREKVESGTVRRAVMHHTTLAGQRQFAEGGTRDFPILVENGSIRSIRNLTTSVSPMHMMHPWGGEYFEEDLKKRAKSSVEEEGL